jgi:hypothetical protein
VIAYYAALAFVLACTLSYVFVNGAFDVGRFVTAVPVVAVLFLVMSLAVRVIFRRARTLAVRPNAYGIVGHDQRIGLALGLLGLVVSGVMTAVTAVDVRSYQAAPSCQAGFAAAPGGGGPCRVAFGRITNVYHTGRRMAEAMTIQFNDGSRHKAVVAQNLSGRLWRAAYGGTALDATVQLFGARIVQVSTSAGAVQTTDHPQHQMFQWMVVGMVSGFFGLASAIGMAFRGLA